MRRVMLAKIGMVVLGGLAVVLGAEAQGLQGGSEPVASLTQVQGTVMVNHGKNYVAARFGTPLRPGARILTMDKSSASVAYKDSCVRQLKENGLLVVRGPADCEATGTVKTVGPFYATAIGSETKSDAGPNGSGNSEDDDKSGAAFWSSGHFWGGVTVFGGGAAYIYNANRNDRAVGPN